MNELFVRLDAAIQVVRYFIAGASHQMKTVAAAAPVLMAWSGLIHQEYSLTQLRRMLGLDLSGFDFDGPSRDAPFVSNISTGRSTATDGAVILP
ncbi:hypothetical protein [Bradyrhizobium ivorense]|nr:hypothetical protein [Bradyrhizobium ivorense]